MKKYNWEEILDHVSYCKDKVIQECIEHIKNINPALTPRELLIQRIELDRWKGYSVLSNEDLILLGEIQGDYTHPNLEKQELVIKELSTDKYKLEMGKLILKAMYND